MASHREIVPLHQKRNGLKTFKSWAAATTTSEKEKALVTYA